MARAVVRFAASPSDTFEVSDAWMVGTLMLAAGGDCFLLIWSNERFDFLMRLLVNLKHLLMSLLRSQRRIGTDALDLRACFLLNGVEFLDGGSVESGLLQTRRNVAAVRGTHGRCRGIGVWSILCEGRCHKE